MCIVYNTVGSLTMVKSHLDRHNITEFKSLHEVLTFQKSYKALRQQIISNAEQAIEKEKGNLILENQALTKAIEATKVSMEKELLEDMEYLRARVQELRFIPNKRWIASHLN